MLRLAAILIVAATATGLTIWIAGKFNLEISDWGWGNLSLICVLVVWYATDALFPRRAIYELWGDTEGPLRLELRLWRKILLLTCIVLGLASAGIALHPIDPTTGESSAAIKIPTEALRPLFVLVGAYLAAVGWLYTTFEKEKGDRASNTLMAIRDQLYDSKVASTLLLLQLMKTHVQRKLGLKRTSPIPLTEMSTKIEILPEDLRREECESLTLEEVLDQFLDALNQLALGARLGQFDFRTIKFVLRPRFIRYAFVYAEYLRQETNAVYEENTGRWRSQVRTWEHFLWLVSKLDVLETDNVDRAHFVMPPPNLDSKATPVNAPRKPRKTDENLGSSNLLLEDAAPGSPNEATRL